MKQRRLLAGMTLVAALVVACGTETSNDTSADDNVATSASTTPPKDEPSTETSGVGAPDWYAKRPRFNSCGVDAEYTDGYPNIEARECFRQAYEKGTRVEVTTVTYGDEGESLRAHFRILEPGSYEIIGKWTPGSYEPGGSAAEEGWERWSCDRFVFLEEPGSEVDGVPVVNAEGECEEVEQVPS